MIDVTGHGPTGIGRVGHISLAGGHLESPRTAISSPSRLLSRSHLRMPFFWP
jgi:hypothetical protein